jgi:hypothetical protein
MSPRGDSRLSTAPADHGEGDAAGEADFQDFYRNLIELAEDNEPFARAALVARQARTEGVKNDSHSSLSSQELEDMLAEAVGDGDGEHGLPRDFDSTVRAAVKPRYRAPNSTNFGGTIDTFTMHIGPHSDNDSPGQTHSYTLSSQPTPSKFMAMSNVQPTSPVASNSRGFVFRNTDDANMEAHAQARTLEELDPHPSHSGPFLGSQTPSPDTTGGRVTMQFLPPQAGMLQPKVYHNKNTGRVLEPQYAFQHMSSMSQPTTTLAANQEIQAATAGHHQYPLAPASSTSFFQLSTQVCGSQSPSLIHTDRYMLFRVLSDSNSPGTMDTSRTRMTCKVNQCFLEQVLRSTPRNNIHYQCT